MHDSVALLKALIDGRTNADEEARILTLLREATAEGLNAMLTGVDVDDLLSTVDNRILGPDNRTALIRLLSVDRVAELSTESLAAVVHALQTGYTSREEERAARDIIRSQRGMALTDLKNTINARPDAHDLEGLVYNGVDDVEIRAEILDHIATEAATLGTIAVKVLSDIDDTAFARIHDTRYPKGTLIPGVLAFYAALDAGPGPSPRSLGDVTFITARPGDAMGLVEGVTRRALRNAGIARSAVLTGGFRALIRKGDMADKKMENVAHYRALFPEYDVVFIGDSGQADPLVGARMLAEHASAVRAVFIHDVVDTPADERAAKAAEGLHYVDTYVGAAGIAHRAGLISRAGLDDVIRETREGLDAVEWSSPDQEQAMRGLVERDIAAAA